jgi:hypothetical protein
LLIPNRFQFSGAFAIGLVRLLLRPRGNLAQPGLDPILIHRLFHQYLFGRPLLLGLDPPRAVDLLLQLFLLYLLSHIEIALLSHLLILETLLEALLRFLHLLSEILFGGKGFQFLPFDAHHALRNLRIWRDRRKDWAGGSGLGFIGG